MRKFILCVLIVSFVIVVSLHAVTYFKAPVISRAAHTNYRAIPNNARNIHADRTDWRVDCERGEVSVTIDIGTAPVDEYEVGPMPVLTYRWNDVYASAYRGHFYTVYGGFGGSYRTTPLLRTLEFTFPLYAVALALACLITWIGWPIGKLWYVRYCKNRIGFCTKCGYDLRASYDRCPECGTSFKRTSNFPTLVQTG